MANLERRSDLIDTGEGGETGGARQKKLDCNRENTGPPCARLPVYFRIKHQLYRLREWLSRCHCMQDLNRLLRVATMKCDVIWKSILLRVSIITHFIVIYKINLTVNYLIKRLLSFICWAFIYFWKN